MARRIEKSAECIMLPEGTKHAKRYICVCRDGRFLLIDKKTNEAVLSYQKVEYRADFDMYMISSKYCMQMVRFDKKGNIIISQPFNKVIKWLSYFVILDVMGETKIMEAPETNPNLTFKTGEEMFFGDVEFVTLYSADVKNNGRVLVEVKTLQTYPKEFTAFEMSVKAGFIAVRLVDSGKKVLVNLKDFTESEEYDNVSLYKFGDEVSSDYAIVKKGDNIGIMNTRDFKVILTDYKKLTPINNEYMFVHNGNKHNIMRLADGQIAKW